MEHFTAKLLSTVLGADGYFFVHCEMDGYGDPFVTMVEAAPLDNPDSREDITDLVEHMCDMGELATLAYEEYVNRGVFSYS